MKAKVIRRFRDKRTGNIRIKGEEFTLNKDRFAEIESVGHFVEEINPKSDAPEVDTPEAGEDEE